MSNFTFFETKYSVSPIGRCILHYIFFILCFSLLLKQTITIIELKEIDGELEKFHRILQINSSTAISEDTPKEMYLKTYNNFLIRLNSIVSDLIEIKSHLPASANFSIIKNANLCYYYAIANTTAFWISKMQSIRREDMQLSGYDLETLAETENLIFKKIDEVNEELKEILVILHLDRNKLEMAVSIPLNASEIKDKNNLDFLVSESKNISDFDNVFEEMNKKIKNYKDEFLRIKNSTFMEKNDKIKKETEIYENLKKYRLIVKKALKKEIPIFNKTERIHIGLKAYRSVLFREWAMRDMKNQIHIDSLKM